MKIKSKIELSYEEILPLLTEKFPEYQVSIDKNPLLRFKYILVKQSSIKGAYIRILKNNTLFVSGAIPSFGMRFLLLMAGYILFFIFLGSSMSKIGKPVGEFLKEKYAV